MKQRPTLCGNSSHVYTPPPEAEDRREPADPHHGTPIHLPPLARVELAFRVIAVDADGQITLVCLGATREEVVRRARAEAHNLPSGVTQLFLERWEGGLLKGEWKHLPCRRRELSPISSRPFPRRPSGRGQ